MQKLNLTFPLKVTLDYFDSVHVKRGQNGEFSRRKHLFPEMSELYERPVI